VQIGRKPFTKEESWTRLLRYVGRFEEVPADQVLGGANGNSVPRGARRRGKQDAEPWLMSSPIASKKQSLAESPGRKENLTWPTRIVVVGSENKCLVAHASCEP
jgi:hypothetical protein